MVVFVLLACASTAGLLATAAARRWPSVDPTRAAEVSARETAEHPRIRRSFVRARIDPRTATGLGFTLALLGVIAGGTVLGLFAFLVRASDTGLLGIDRAAAVWGAEHAGSVSTFVLGAITHLGATITISAFVIALGTYEYRRTRSLAIPAYLLVVAVGQLVVVNLIKVLVARTRPDIDPLSVFSGASFPSGHTTAAAAVFAAAALVLGRGRSLRTRSILAGAAVAIAVAVAATRVLLGVHWLSDVVAGLALGWSLFAVCSIAFGGRMMRFGAPVVAAQRIAGEGAGHGPPEATKIDAHA